MPFKLVLDTRVGLPLHPTISFIMQTHRTTAFFEGKVVSNGESLDSLLKGAPEVDPTIVFQVCWIDAKTSDAKTSPLDQIAIGLAGGEARLVDKTKTMYMSFNTPEAAREFMCAYRDSLPFYQIPAVDTATVCLESNHLSSANFVTLKAIFKAFEIEEGVDSFLRMAGSIEVQKMAAERAALQQEFLQDLEAVQRICGASESKQECEEARIKHTLNALRQRAFEFDTCARLQRATATLALAETLNSFGFCDHAIEILESIVSGHADYCLAQDQIAHIQLLQHKLSQNTHSLSLDENDNNAPLKKAFVSAYQAGSSQLSSLSASILCGYANGKADAFLKVEDFEQGTSTEQCDSTEQSGSPRIGACQLMLKLFDVIKTQKEEKERLRTQLALLQANNSSGTVNSTTTTSMSNGTSTASPAAVAVIVPGYQSSGDTQQIPTSSTSSGPWHPGIRHSP